MRIRPAKKTDITGMSLLLTQLFSIESDFKPDEKKQSQGLSLLLDARGAHILVAEEQGAIVAMATVQILVSTAEGGHVGLIEDVVVDQGYRGKGIGKALLNHLHEWAQDNGLTRLQLAADRDNSSALEFYVRNGWKQTNLVLLRRGRL